MTSDITLGATLPNITSEITIEGANHFISGDGSYHIFHVEESGSLTVNQLQLKNGSGQGHSGGAILNRQGTVAVNNSQFNSNSASMYGGAIASQGGTTTITSSSFSNNSSDYMGGALFTSNLGRLTVTSSTLSSNSADNFGGAIAASGSYVTIHGSKLKNNTSPKGGAIWNSALSYISNSEISNNSSTGNGGAIYAGGNTLTVTNSTVSDNSASGNGGGVFVQRVSGRVTLKHVTVANNSAASGGGVYKDERGTLNALNSIIAGSTNNDCVDGLDQNVGNYIEDGSCSPSLSSADGPINLGTLTGSPAYFPLLAGSPAIDAADANYCPATDQAGNARPIGAACDIGAHESSALPATATATETPTPPATATNTPTPTMTPTPTATSTPIPPTNTPVPTATNTATATATPSEFCVNVGPGTYWEFPVNSFLNGLITVYPGDTCEPIEIYEVSIGESGYVYTTAGQAAAVALCAAAHNDGSTYTVVQQAYNTDLWQCALPTPTDMPTSTATNTSAQATPVITIRPISETEWAELLGTETNTPIPTDTAVLPKATNTSAPANNRAIAAVGLASN